MQVEHKDATITPTGIDTDFPGTFEVILSAPTLDRDGDTLGSDEWKTPLPDKITFDSDHGMSVATTGGAGVPSINEKGQLVVAGTYSSLPRAQEVRTLVNEGHINTTSVAFMTMPKTSKDSKPVRELLNGAFVAIPSNREALVLSSKSGARNNTADTKSVQAIHDASAALGADCSMGKSFDRKDAGAEDDTDPVALISAVDAAVDEALALLAGVDLTTLPAEVQQAIALIQAADVASDELLDTLGIPDPDEDANAAAEVDPAAAAKAAAAVETKAAVDAESDAVTDEEIEAKALAIFGAQFI